MPKTELPSKTLVLGLSGSGKTTWVKEQIKLTRRAVIFDPKDEYDLADRISLRELPDVLGQAQCRCRIVPAPAADIQPQFDALAYALLHMQRATNLTLVVDEAFMVCPKSGEGWLGKVLRLCRAKSIDVYMVSQRAVGMPGIVQAEATRLILFHLHNPYDLQAVANLTEPKIAKRLPTLRRFEFIRYQISL